MPETATRPGVSREMRLVSKLIAAQTDEGDDESALCLFIARRRHPNAGPMSWDRVTYELAQVIGEIVTDPTLRKWAAAYGIPDGGRNITLTVKEYERGLKAANISL